MYVVKVSEKVELEIPDLSREAVERAFDEMGLRSIIPDRAGFIRQCMDAVHHGRFKMIEETK